MRRQKNQASSDAAVEARERGKNYDGRDEGYYPAKLVAIGSCRVNKGMKRRMLLVLSASQMMKAPRLVYGEWEG